MSRQQFREVVDLYRDRYVATDVEIEPELLALVIFSQETARPYPGVSIPAWSPRGDISDL